MNRFLGRKRDKVVGVDIAKKKHENGIFGYFLFSAFSV